jgi:dipeptidyl aminopeptidase/acylaminoacyl peptidase
MKLHQTCAAALALAVGLGACGGGKKQPTVPVDVLPGDKDSTPGDTDTAGGGDATPEPAVAQGHPKDDLIPRSVLYGNPQKANLQISPDGKWLSWVGPVNGVLNVWVSPSDDVSKAKSVTADTTRPVRSYFWTFDNKHVIYQQDKAGDENFHLFSVDLATGTSTDLVPSAGARVELAGLSPRKPNTVLVSVNDRNPQFFDLYSVDLTTGDKTLLIQNDEFAAIASDNDLNVRFGYATAPDGSNIVKIYDAKKKTWKEYDKIGLDDQWTTNIVGFDKKGTSYYIIDSRNRDTAALYSVNIKTKKKKLVFQDKKADVGGILIHPTEATVEAVNVDFEKPTWNVIDKKVKKDFAALAKLEDGTPVITGTTLDNKTWIVLFDSDHKSPRYYRWDRTAQKGELLFAIRPELDEVPLARMFPNVIKSRDGLDLVSYLTLPNEADAEHDGKADKPVPMVLFVHGGPWARDSWGFNTVHQTLANRGYAVLSVNFRGSTGFGKKFLNASNLQWGKTMHDDLLDAVQWAIDQGVAPKDKICIMGGSYGGYATLVGVAMTPDVFACGVDMFGMSDLVTLQETIPPYWGPLVPVLHARIGDPTTEEGKAALKEISPLTHASDIKVPLLIAQGKNDPRVNESQSQQIVDAMKAKKIPVSYVLFPDEGHGFARPENNIAFFAVAEAFLSVHLGGFYQPITPDEVAASTMQVVAGREWLPGLPAKGKQVSVR